MKLTSETITAPPLFLLVISLQCGYGIHIIKRYYEVGRE
jgi:predicted RND superfamily exporter protein